MDKEKITNHPSQGLLSFSRISCGGGGENLFGSDIKHANFITLRIHEAERSRHLNQYWDYPRSTVIEVDLSYAQFAESIASMNTQGIPCTLRHVRDGNLHKVDRPEPNNVREEFEKELHDDMNEIAEGLDELREMAQSLYDGKTASKKDRKAILEQIRSVKQDICSNLPFVESQYKKHLDDKVSDAKIEIEAYALHKSLARADLVELIVDGQETRLIE